MAGHNDFGAMDIAAVLKFTENSNTAYRRALHDGARDMHHFEDELAPGSTDFKAASMVGQSYFDEARYEELQRAVLGIKPANLLSSFLQGRYILHPDHDEILNARVFVYLPNKDQKDKSTLDLHPVSTLRFCQISSEHPHLAELEAVLEAEKSLGDNPLVLREALKQVPPSSYVWWPRR